MLKSEPSKLKLKKLKQQPAASSMSVQQQKSADSAIAYPQHQPTTSSAEGISAQIIPGKLQLIKLNQKENVCRTQYGMLTPLGKCQLINFAPPLTVSSTTQPFIGDTRFKKF